MTVDGFGLGEVLEDRDELDALIGGRGCEPVETTHRGDVRGLIEDHQ